MLPPPMLRLPLRLPLSAGMVFCALFAPSLHAAVPSASPVLSIDGLGKGAAPLDGPWQFHIGDDPAWAQPQTPDPPERMAGNSPPPANEGWGTQGHPETTSASPGIASTSTSLPRPVPPESRLYIPAIDDAYELYW